MTASPPLPGYPTLMSDWIRRMPKAELHVHLEGSLGAETLRQFDPALTDAAVAERYTYADFGAFLKAFAWASGYLKGPEEYAIATSGLLRSLEREGVTYAEITFSAGVALWRNLDVPAIHQAMREAAAASSIRTAWIWDSVRQFGGDLAWRVVQLAVARAGDGVVAFGLGGDEARGPARDYAEQYTYARKGGLRLVCHAGESTGPESVWDALEVGAERIGHGIASVDDPVLIRHLADNTIPLEVCITSNHVTGVARRFQNYPLRALYDAGVPIVLNTDDPPMFQATLCGEYDRAAREYGLPEEELRGLAENSFRYAFLR